MRNYTYQFHKIRNSLVFLCGVVVFITVAVLWERETPDNPGDNARSQVISKISRTSIPFITNQGQCDPNINFYTQTLGGSVFVTESAEVIYSLTNNPKNRTATNLVFKEDFPGIKASQITGENRAITNVNYFIGNNSANWKNNIPTYEMIALGTINDGIQIKLKAYGNKVEKLFYIRPGSSPDDIWINISGANQININDVGELEVALPHGMVSFTKPLAYQELPGGREFVEISYLTKESSYGFLVGDYNHQKELIIDPLLASTMLGGWCDDICYGPFIETDESGNVYLSGFTCTPTFPTSPGAFQNQYAGGTLDCFISKFSNDLTTLIASTFLGGSGFETECSITLDKKGNIYAGGYTDSQDFPTTPGAFSEVNNGAYDIFISKLSNDLTTLISSTYIGGSSNDGFETNRIDLIVGDDGVLYFAGQSRSDDFPTTPGAYDSTFGGAGPYEFSGDAVVVKMDSTLSNLLASTYLGGSNDEFRVSIDLDNDQNIFVSTSTYSSNISTTPGGGYDESFNGNCDVFISKLSNDLTTQLAATYLGHSVQEVPLVVQTDLDGNVYVSGFTSSSNLPTTPGVYDEDFNGVEDGFISKFDNSLSTLLASTFLGGSAADNCQALLIHENGDVYVTGKTLSANFPIIPGTYDDDYNGGSEHGDIFVSKLDGNLTSLSASTFLGGSDDEKSFGIALDSSGNVFVGGFTHSTDFPTTPGAYDSTFGGIRDIIVTKLLLQPSTGINEQSNVPGKIFLNQNYPNPFNPLTHIEYAIPKAMTVVLKIYDLTGREVRTLVNERQTSGLKSVVWDGTDNSGELVSSGIYIYRIQTDNATRTTQSKKMLFLK